MASNFCRNCGARLTPGKSFCGQCGTMVIRSEQVPVQEPVAAPVAAPVPVTVGGPVPEAAPAAVPAAEPAAPQPMQTVVTYHPDVSVTEQLPPEAVAQVPAAAAVPTVVPAAEPVQTMAVIPAAQVPAAAEPAPVMPAAEPKKKKHTGLIIGLICGGAAVVAFIVVLVILFAGYAGRTSGSGNSTVLDRIETMEEVASGKNYTIYDKGFEKNVESARWWDYDGTMKSQGVYYNNTKTIAFSVKVDEKTTEKLYYAFYYSKDNDFDKNDLEDAETSDTIGPSYYKDGNAYYNIECGKDLKPGYYCVIVSKDKSFAKPYIVAYAKVLDVRS